MTVRRCCTTRGQHTQYLTFSLRTFFSGLFNFLKYRFGGESWAILVILVFYAELLFWFQWSGQLWDFFTLLVIHLKIDFKSEVSSAVWIPATMTLHPSLQNNKCTNCSRLCLPINCRTPLKSDHYLSIRHTNVSLTLFHGESESVRLSIPQSHPILQYFQYAPDSTAKQKRCIITNRVSGQRCEVKERAEMMRQWDYFTGKV